MADVVPYKKAGDSYPPVQVMEIVDHFLLTADNGFLSLTFQDGYVVKIERNEKYIITAKNRQTGYVKYGKPGTAHPLHEKIAAELQQIQYGQFVIHLKNGKVEHIEKTEKRRMSEQENLHGAGI